MTQTGQGRTGRVGQLLCDSGPDERGVGWVCERGKGPPLSLPRLLPPPSPLLLVNACNTRHRPLPPVGPRPRSYPQTSTFQHIRFVHSQDTNVNVVLFFFPPSDWPRGSIFVTASYLLPAPPDSASQHSPDGLPPLFFPCVPLVASFDSFTSPTRRCTVQMASRNAVSPTLSQEGGKRTHSHDRGVAFDPRLPVPDWCQRHMQ